jgi:hypothetical protein
MSGSASGGGPANARSASRMKGKKFIRRDLLPLCPHARCYSSSQTPNDVESRTRTYPNAAPPGGRRNSPSARNNTSTPGQGQPHANANQMPYPRTYARSVYAFLFIFSHSKPAHPTLRSFSDVNDRLSLMGSTFTLVWFVLAQIFMYSSIKTCRHSSPHLWWLTFGLLSVMYVMILEVVIVAILVFVVGPILFVCINCAHTLFA